MSQATIVLVGHGRVGTSSLVQRYIRGIFTDHYQPTMAEVMRYTKRVYSSPEQTSVVVQICDVEGSDRHNALACCQRAHAIGVVYDVTNTNSFNWAKMLLEAVNPRASALLIGNKSDLGDGERKVSPGEGQQLAHCHRVDFIETSAKLNFNVDEALQILIGSIPGKYLRF